MLILHIMKEPIGFFLNRENSNNVADTHDNTCTYIHIHMHPHTHDNTCT